MHKEQALDAAFAALSDPSRRKILALLRESPELRISDLASCFDMTLNGVSKHVKVLERAGLVARRIDGRVHWIRAHWHGLEAPFSWLNSHHHYWTTRIDALVDHLKEHP